MTGNGLIQHRGCLPQQSFLLCGQHGECHRHTCICCAGWHAQKSSSACRLMSAWTTSAVSRSQRTIWSSFEGLLHVGEQISAPVMLCFFEIMLCRLSWMRYKCNSNQSTSNVDSCCSQRYGCPLLHARAADHDPSLVGCQRRQAAADLNAAEVHVCISSRRGGLVPSNNSRLCWLC